MYKLDNNFRPQDNFFKYVNNNWLKKNTIPNYASSWGTFNKMAKETYLKINKIIKDVVAEPNDNRDIKNFKKFVKTARNYSKFRDNHIESLKIEILKINNIKNLDDLNSYLGYAHKIGISVFWDCYVDVDDKNSETQVIRLNQGGLTMPNRDYYLDKAQQKTIIEYRQYFSKIIKEIPWLNNLNWENIYKVEAYLAKMSAPEEDLRNIDKCYNNFSLVELMERWPSFNWINYFTKQGWQPNNNIIVNQPEFIDACLSMINEESIVKICNYMTWKLVNQLVNLIDKDFNKLKDSFFGKSLNGNTKPLANYMRVIRLINDCGLGDILGKEFIKQYFSKKSKSQINQMVNDIKESYHKRIDNISWMSLKTKEMAHAKLSKIRVFIGYPDKWRDFKDLSLVDDNLVENYLRAQVFHNNYELNKIGQKTDPDEWFMEAYTVNAYHDPNRLVICFPAGILQAPFYNSRSDYATNMGGIGTIIGHELTHGFDDMGCDFDQYGNNKPWQTKRERQEFNRLSEKLVKQVSNYEILPGLKMNGKLVIGEIIADIGGIELAIEALKSKYKKTYGKYIKKLLINFATCECGKERKKAIYRMTKSNPHPISNFRVNFTLMHINDFYKSYKLSSKDKLFLPEDQRINIW